MPHFPARSLKNKAELKDFVHRCKDGGVKQALIIGGSAQPIGDFHCSLQLLETGLFEGWKIGIAGHPDGSPDISDSDLEKAMIDKKPYADYIVTQWLLDSNPIAKFISKQTLPVHVGITGPLKISSLLKFANIVGAKNSINFLKSNVTKAVDLLKPKDPNDMIEKLKSFKVGDVLNETYTINRIVTEVTDDYYHSAGLSLTKKGEKESKWEDVYSLTRWFYDDIFKEEKK